MKDLKNYAQLYLGCEAHTQFGQGTFFRYDVDTGAAWVVFGTMGPDFERCMLIEHVKPILRTLSDMADGEKDEYMNLKPTNVKGLSKYVIDAAFYTKWLLSKHFDLFGLIEAGLAIDKTTLTK